jgi:plastocyanin
LNRRRFLAGVALASASLAGCASDDGGSASPTETQDESPTSNEPVQTATGTRSDTQTATETPTTADTQGGTQTPDESPTDSPTETPEAPSAREQYPDYDWERLEGADPVSTRTLTIRDFEFRPLAVAVRPGTDLTVVNEDGLGHTFSVPKLGIDERIPSGERVSVTLEESGTFDYVCSFHPPGMVGRVVVTSTATEESTPVSPTPTETQTGDDGRY